MVEQYVAQRATGARSYRCAEKSFNSLTGLHLDHSTYHRWVLNTGADEINVPEYTLAAVPGKAGRWGAVLAISPTNPKLIRQPIFRASCDGYVALRSEDISKDHGSEPATRRHGFTPRTARPTQGIHEWKQPIMAEIRVKSVA